ncbi:MAG: hypothetical protein D6712_10015 [Chloroflexi bacterium]|nr:MAG: hypothetical protein D6712_10015 [Chloroflexota bacterium]
MVKIARLFTSLLLAMLVILPAAAQDDEDLPQPPLPDYVLIIVMDGLRPDAIAEVETPNFDFLIENGAVDMEAKTVFPPATLPAITSILTGYDVEQHGVDWNSDEAVIIETPTVLTLAQEAGYRAAMVVGKTLLNQLHQRDDVVYEEGLLGDRSVVNRTIELLEDGYEVLFVHFPNPDFFGHRRGWMSEIYLFELEETDRQLGRLLAELDTLGIADDTLIIVTSDHGGSDFNHGADIPEDMLVPWIIVGAGVAQGVELEDISVMDTAATVLWALDLPLPEDLDGRPVIEAFEIED